VAETLPLSGYKILSLVLAVDLRRKNRFFADEMTVEAKEISVQPTAAAEQSTPRWAGLQPGEVVEARVVAVNDDRTITIRLMGSLARLDSDAFVAAAGELPAVGSLLKLKCLEASVTPKLLLIATLLDAGEDHSPVSVASQAGLTTLDIAGPAQFAAPSKEAELPPAVRQGIEALAASFRHANLAEARLVVANLVKFAVPVTEENFNPVLNAASLRGTEAEASMAGGGGGASFAARAQMAAFLLSQGVAPTSEMLDILVPRTPTDAAPEPVESPVTSAAGQMDARSLVEPLTDQKVAQAPATVTPDQVKAMLSGSEKLPLFDLSLQVVAELLRMAGESGGDGEGAAGQTVPAGVRTVVSHEQALAALFALFDQIGSKPGETVAQPASLSAIPGKQDAAGSSAQVLKDAVAVILKELGRSELELLAGRLRAAEESEITRALGLQGRKIAAQNETAGRNVALKILDIAASSRSERTAHFELSLPTSGTANRARMRVSWHAEGGEKQVAAEPRQIVILLDMSRLGRVLAFGDFSRPKALGLRFYVRDRAVRALVMRHQDELRSALARLGYNAAISAAVDSERAAADPFEPHIPGRFQGGVDIKI
jgi:hypothetical protein